MTEVLLHYHLSRGSKLRSSDASRHAMQLWTRFRPEALVSELDVAAQRAFVAWMLEQEYEPGGVARVWAVIRAAVRRAAKAQLIVNAPDLLTARDLELQSGRRDRVLTVGELAALFDAAATHDLEHMWRWLLISIATAARPEAALQLTDAQIDRTIGVVDLLPPGLAQTKKHRPKVPICRTLDRYLAQWGTGRYVTFRGRPLTSVKMGWKKIRARAGINDASVVPYAVRHTVATWLRRKGVPEWDASGFMGHRGRGSATTEVYAHYRPEYMRAAADAVDELLAEIARLVKVRPLLDVENQPDPSDEVFLMLAGVGKVG